MHSKGNYKQGVKTTLRMGENNKWSNWQRINFQNIQAAHTTQCQKNKQPNPKVGKRPKQIFLQRRYAAAAKSLQSCPTLCDLIDGSPPGSPVPGILQARTLEWIAISFSNAWKWKVKVKSLSRVQLYRLTNTWKYAQHRSLLEKCKSKPQWDITSHQSEWLSSKSLQTINAGDVVEKREHSCTVGGNINWYSHYGRQYGDSLKSRNKTTIWPSNPTPRPIPCANQNWKRHLYPIVHCSTICNS